LPCVFKLLQQDEAMPGLTGIMYHRQGSLKLLIGTTMAKRRRRSDVIASGVPVQAILANLGTPLLGLPDALIADIASRAARLGAGGALSLTCRTFAKIKLWHAPFLRIQLDSQRCDQMFTPRVVAALQSRRSKLALTLEQQQEQNSRQYIRLLTKVLKKLASCAAVESCNLRNTQKPSQSPLKPLHCSPDIAQHFMGCFPGLTSLSLHNYTISCRGLASLLAHPRLSLQLQQLDLSSTTVTQQQAQQPKPGAATLANLFHASRLKQLSLLIDSRAEGENRPLLPNLQPLSQHLTQLCIQQREGMVWDLSDFTATLPPLAQMQVLTISSLYHVGGMPELLQAFPRLHTLQLPDAAVKGQEQLDTLRAATQLTSIQLGLLGGLTSSRADVPCSWQRLELTGCVDHSSAAYLPLHSLTQPLLLGTLIISINGDDAGCAVVAVAVHNLTQACKVSVRIKVLRLSMFVMPDTPAIAAKQQVKLQQLVPVMQTMSHGSWGMVYVTHLILDTEGSASAAMHQSLQLMADQPWARWLDICIAATATSMRPKPSYALPEAYPAARAPSPLLSLPAGLVDDVVSRAVQLGAGGVLSLTYRTFSQTNLLHASAFRIQLDTHPCNQLLTSRVVASLSARTRRFALTLEQPQALSSGHYMRLLHDVLNRLGSCAAAETCKLVSLNTLDADVVLPLDCMDLAQHMIDSFPRLTSLAFHGFSIPCNSLAALLSHQQLSLQLQQLDLTGSTITQPKRPMSGAVTLANLFHGVRLQHFSLDVGAEVLMPDLQPLAQHLTQLHVRQLMQLYPTLTSLAAALGPLPQLQVLTVSRQCFLTNLPEVLRAFPRLHTLQLPGVTLWQRLELTHWIDCSTAAYLPLHSLIQPLLLGGLSVGMGNDGDNDVGEDGGDPSLLVAAAVHNLTQACKVPVTIKALELDCAHRAQLAQFEAMLQPLRCCGLQEVVFSGMQGVSAADVPALAALCQGCTRLQFSMCSLMPSLEFWRQLVQLMPSVTHITCWASEGVATAAMLRSLRLMVKQPWSRILEVCIKQPSGPPTLPACCKLNNPSQPGKLRGPWGCCLADGAIGSKGKTPQVGVGAVHQAGHVLIRADWPQLEPMHLEHTPGLVGLRCTQHTLLLDLPPALLDDIACRVMQLGARSLLPLTCCAFSQARLLHVPALHIQLCRPRCDQLLTPRVVAALQARTSKLALTLEQPETVDSRWFSDQLAPTLQLLQTEYTQDYTDLLAHALAKLGNCAAVEVCSLVSSGQYTGNKRRYLHCPPGLAQHLLGSFPSLTALTLQGLCVSSNELASLLSHSSLALQLQRLHLTDISFQDGDEGAVGLTFQGLQLKQLSIAFEYPGQLDTILLPSFQPLAQHLTQLHLARCKGVNNDLSDFMKYLQPLAQLQVLTLSHLDGLQGLTESLQALPQLHTLQLPKVNVTREQKLDALLAATQITSLQLREVNALDTSYADAPCSWQRLELTFTIAWKAITYLPLHSLSQPLVLGHLLISEEDISDPEVAAAIHLLAYACKVPVQIKKVLLWVPSEKKLRTGPTVFTPTIVQQQRVDLAQLVAMLQPLQCCCSDNVSVIHLHEVTAADVLALAPLCRDCTHFELYDGSVEPSLGFWHQLVQLMPAVQKVTFYDARLLYVPALHIQLGRQCCDQLLTPRVVAALQARTSKLALTLWQPKTEDSECYIDLLAHTLPKLDNCAAVEPLAQHLTELHLKYYSPLGGVLVSFMDYLQPLAQLQVLTLDSHHCLQGLPALLQALPQLHTLQLPGSTNWGQQELDTLLAATQLTSIQLELGGTGVRMLDTTYADAPCSWQRVELLGNIDWKALAYLPLHSHSQPQVLNCLNIGVEDISNPEVAAALRNMAYACKVPVKIKCMRLYMLTAEEQRSGAITPALLQQQRVDLAQLVAMLQPLQCCGQQTVPDMSQRDMQHQVTVDGGVSATDGYSPAGEAPPPATRLLDLPPALLDDIACRVMQLGARNLLPLTCRAFSQARLLHVPALRIQLGRQCCDQLLTPRVVAALQARTSKLDLTLWQPVHTRWYEEEFAPTLQLQKTGYTQHYTEQLAYALTKLDNCAAVEVCKLVCSVKYEPNKRKQLCCSPGLAQQLLDSFPSLTALTLEGLCVSNDELASLLSHPPLALQLQQLHLTHIFFQDGEELGAVGSVFEGLQLKQLSIAVEHREQPDSPLLPSFQPLAQHLTQLHLVNMSGLYTTLSAFMEYLQPLAQLQVLTMSYHGPDGLHGLEGLPRLLQALPLLHTLQLPIFDVRCQHQLDTLLAATQLTSLQLYTFEALDTTYADVPCSWQRLELTGCDGWKALTYLPLHSLSQPLVLGQLHIRVEDISDPEVAAAIHLLAYAIKVPVQIRVVQLIMLSREQLRTGPRVFTPTLLQQQRVDLAQLVALLQPLQRCFVDKVVVRDLYGVTAADVLALAPLCQECTHFVLDGGSIEPSLGFWHHLVQLMPAVQQVEYNAIIPPSQPAGQAQRLAGGQQGSGSKPSSQLGTRAAVLAWPDHVR
ncbi:hypothetical protein QJQ45_024888, partial [Haematococcus lacustris]